MWNSEENEREGATSWGDPLMGKEIDGRYRIDALLGSGNTGRVYRATQLSVERDVAVKVLRGNFRNDPQYRKRFFREAKVISGFNHPNIVRLIDFGEAEGGEYSYLVMELVEGVELAALLQRGALDTRLAVEVVYQTAAALIEAHNAEIIHRDLKTQNILLLVLSNGSMQVKVLDFGVAFPKDKRGERLTNAGQIFGTPAYMSPEQGEGRDVDPPADIYSLGVIFFEMLTGELPFHENSNLATMMKHLEAERPFPSEHASEPLPPEVDALVREMMAIAPEDRPAGARAVRDRIDEIRDQRGWDRVSLDVDAAIEEVFVPFVRADDSAEESELRDLVPAFNEKNENREGSDRSDGRADSVESQPASESSGQIVPASESSGQVVPASESTEIDPEGSWEYEADTLETDTLTDPEPPPVDERKAMRTTVDDETTGEQIAEETERAESSRSQTMEDPVTRRSLVAVAVLLGLLGLLIATIFFVRSSGPAGEGDDEPIVIEAEGSEEEREPSSALAGSSGSAESTDTDESVLAFPRDGGRAGDDVESDSGEERDVSGGAAGEADRAVERAAEESVESEEDDESAAGARGDEDGEPEGDDERTGATEAGSDESGRAPDRDRDDRDKEEESTSEAASDESAESESVESDSAESESEGDEESSGDDLEESMDWVEGG